MSMPTLGFLLAQRYVDARSLQSEVFISRPHMVQCDARMPAPPSSNTYGKGVQYPYSDGEKLIHLELELRPPAVYVCTYLYVDQKAISTSPVMTSVIVERYIIYLLTCDVCECCAGVHIAVHIWFVGIGPNFALFF
jgi:hypothetical protein